MERECLRKLRLLLQKWMYLLLKIAEDLKRDVIQLNWLMSASSEYWTFSGWDEMEKFSSCFDLDGGFYLVGNCFTEFWVQFSAGIWQQNFCTQQISRRLRKILRRKIILTFKIYAQTLQKILLLSPPRLEFISSSNSFQSNFPLIQIPLYRT